MTNVDTYDGHLIRTYYDGDDLAHDVIHPPTCQMVERYGSPDAGVPGILEHTCAVAFCLDAIGPNECFDHNASTPGVRIVGWRHDTYNAGWGSVEHDVVCFCLPTPIALGTEGP